MFCGTWPQKKLKYDVIQWKIDGNSDLAKSLVQLQKCKSKFCSVLLWSVALNFWTFLEILFCNCAGALPALLGLTGGRVVNEKCPGLSPGSEYQSPAGLQDGLLGACLLLSITLLWGAERRAGLSLRAFPSIISPWTPG